MKTWFGKLGKWPRKRVGVLVGILVLVVGAGGAAIAVAAANLASSTFASPTPAATVEQSQTANGLTLTLKSVDVTSSQTQLKFNASLPPKVAASTAYHMLEPGLTPDITFRGIEPLPGGLALAPAGVHQMGETTLTFTMVLAPVISPTSPVVVNVHTLRFKMRRGSLGLHPLVLNGPWSFTIPPTAFTANVPVSTQAPNAQASAGGITIHVDRIENQPSGLSIYYSISSALSRAVRPLIPSVQLVFPDGSRSQSAPMQDAAQGSSASAQAAGGGYMVQPDQTRQFISVFPSLAHSSIQAKLVFSDFVTTVDSPASFTIVHPFGQWSAKPFVADGDQFKVTESKSTPDGQLTIVVTNQEPVDKADIYFVGLVPPSPPVTATDAQGHRYTSVLGVSTSRHQGDQVYGADATRMMFTGIPSTTKQLTITTPQSGRIVRGTWTIPVNLP